MKEVNLTSTIQEVLRINETFALLLSSCPPLFGDPYFGFFFFFRIQLYSGHWCFFSHFIVQEIYWLSKKSFSSLWLNLFQDSMSWLFGQVGWKIFFLLNVYCWILPPTAYVGIHSSYFQSIQFQKGSWVFAHLYL